MDVRWRPSKVAPDLPRMIAHHRHKASKGAPEDLRAGDGWEGFVRREDQQTLTQAAKYFEPARRLVELVIVWPQARDKALERQLLAGVSPEPLADGRRVWQALGLSVRPPADSALSDYKADPGHVRFDFNVPGGTVSVSRLGLVDRWLTQPLAEWLAGSAGAVARRDCAGVTSVNGHPAEELLTSRRAASWRMLIGRRAWELQRAWVCPACQRAFVVRWRCTSRRPVEAPGVDVGCCAPLAEL